MHTAVIVQPLTREQIDAHLATIGKPLTALRAALKKNTTLRTLVTTPLLLQVLMLTHHNIPLRTLSHRKSQLQEQIWSTYVQQMVSRKGNTTCYSLEQTYIWLGWLARQMRWHNQTVMFLEQWQPDLLSKRQRFFYRSCVVLTIVLIVTLFEVVVWLLIFSVPAVLLDGPQMALGGISEAISGLLLQGLLVGSILGWYVGLRAIHPSELLTWSWKDIRSRSLIGLAIGLSGGAALLIFRGLGIQIVGKRLPKRLSLSPNEGIRRSAKNGILVALPLGLLIGVLYGLGVRVLMDPAFRLYVGPFGELFFELGEGLLYGLFISLALALVFGLDAFIQHYILRFWLWYYHLFPFRAVSFLENATSCNLLRRVGGGYSFTHSLLLDYFADPNTTIPTSSTSPHSVNQSPQL